MATIRIGNVTGAIYQVEQPLHLNPDGSAQATLTYKCAASSQYATVPAYLTPHPFYPKLKCYESDSDVENGGIVRITSIYRGVFASNPEQLAQHEANRTLTEAPIETHPTFAIPFDNPPVTPQQLAAIELALQNCTDPPAEIEGAALTLYNKKRRGIESYLKPGSLYKKTYCSNSIPGSDLLARVGKTFAPPSPCPSPPPNQAYLCMGVSWNKTAGVVTITEEYQLSGPGGWDPDLHPST